MKKTLFILTLFCVSLNLQAQPLNDIVDRKIVKEKKILQYQPIRENDIMWEKRIWRVLDVREKINNTFTYPKEPFFEILTKAAMKGEIPVFSPETDDFSYPMSREEIENTLVHRDTVEIIDPTTYDPIYQEVANELFYEDVKRFRIKEVWFFDSHTATMKVRILGIAPMIESRDEHGNFRFEKPLFWIHYPSSREMLARHTVFNSGNDSSRITWEDLFEMRYFSSYVYKESNVHDLKLEEHYSGVDLLLESKKIEQSIFDYEHDLWEF